MLPLVRWWLTLLGGVLIGGGLVLHGQLAMAHVVRDEVESTFFLWRGIGRITFMFQDEATQVALALHEVTPSVFRESDRVAWALCVIGALLALATPFLRRRRRKGKSGKSR